MWDSVAKIFGSGEVVNKGMKMLDDAFYTSSEEAKDKADMVKFKAEHKIRLLDAYAPFKIAQRYIAIVFLFNFTVSFFLVLGMTIHGKDTKSVLEVIESFQIAWIMITIVMFYFGGGLVDSFKRKSEKSEGKS